MQAISKNAVDIDSHSTSCFRAGTVQKTRFSGTRIRHRDILEAIAIQITGIQTISRVRLVSKADFSIALTITLIEENGVLLRHISCNQVQVSVVIHVGDCQGICLPVVSAKIGGGADASVAITQIHGIRLPDVAGHQIRGSVSIQVGYSDGTRLVPSGTERNPSWKSSCARR